jgi:hypothetical protein
VPSAVPAPPPVSAAPAPPAPPAPVASVAPRALPPKVDLSAILMTQGYLYVRSSVDTKVFVMGKELGTTNQALLANCGMRHVRLGSRLGHFIEPGGPVDIKCRELTELEREPE